ncbi:MAG: hypothetical protein AVW05_04595 [Hadesarchaea archaeon DG-33]|nr:MAG: hypothetical protein AVW05_04595 [Hadesarchaea archaeon DG-33]
MGGKKEPMERVLQTLRECRGAVAVRVLAEEEKKALFELERRVEDNIVFGMCKSRNDGVREALQREFTVAIVIQSSIFQYPHHPHMSLRYDDQVLGESITDREKREELRNNASNFFLWDDFVVYMKKLPRGREAREKMRMIFHPREPLQLRGVPCVANSVFGTPSTEGDALIKRVMNLQGEDAQLGTCLLGFNLHR